MPAGDLRNLLTDGVIGGVGTIVTFLPQILILFFFIGLLENTGYMARAAFIMDRLMSRVGLNGKSFIPLLSSYACAIPGIMATRTIEDPKDRLVTILVAPLMSCSARLPVYLLMIAALLPGTGVSLAAKVGIMVLMYALGTLRRVRLRVALQAHAPEGQAAAHDHGAAPLPAAPDQGRLPAHGRARGALPEARRDRDPRPSASCSGSSRPTRRPPRGPPPRSSSPKASPDGRAT